MKRRRFLQGIGAVAVAAPFLTSTYRSSLALTVAALKRLVLFYTPGGCITTRWFPLVEDGPLTPADLAGTTLEVLAPMASQLLLPRGTCAVNGMARPQSFNPHIQAMGSKLTCSLIDEESQLATSHSLDHAVARQLNPNGEGPLYTNAGWRFMDSSTYISFAGAKEPVEPLANARALYDQLMPSVNNTLSANTRNLMRQSALDLVHDDLARLQAVNMSQSDRLRLSLWTDLVRQTEENLVAYGTICSSEPIGDLDISQEKVDLVSDSETIDGSVRISMGGDVLMDLMALSMMCDTNRSLLFSYPSYVQFNWDRIVHDADIDRLNHRTGSATVSGPCFPDVLTKLLEIDRWYAQKFYRLTSLLATIPEGGTNLLDNTATLWLREFSDGGALNVNNMPLLIAGSCGGYLKQGAAVLLEGEPVGPGNSESTCTEPGDTIDAYTGTDASRGLVPINKLYVTLMNAVGCQAADGGPVTEFGVFDSHDAEAGITDPGELTALKA